MRLLLDEMLSPRIARELREKGHDVQAINGDRTELKATADIEIVRRLREERRVIATNNVRDFRAIHNQFLDRGESHSGIVFTADTELPRNRRSIHLWFEALDRLLEEHPGDEALRNRITHLL